MRLTGQQYKQLREALLEAFPSKQRLSELVRFNFDKNLDAIALGDDLQEIAFKLIGAAEAEGWVERLIVAARESNPGNSRLFVFAQEFNLATPMPPKLSALALEKIIRKKNSFIDVNTWREQLGQIEAQVCRIEITTNKGREFGTGFLIAPNVVITNYHVMETVILKSTAPNQVILRFDYKQLTDGRIINKGTEYRLAEDDWLIDSSPYLADENRLPTLDELDYALLRVDGVPGQEPIGKNPDPNSPQRGWLKLPTERYEFVPNDPLFILQHPNATPLKLAFDTEAIIGVNENGTTVRYKTNTEPGSSGSPCFDINWNLVALHHSGDPNWRNPTYNAGTPLSAICSRLENKDDLLTDLQSGQPI
jgi:hypothetical protein